MTRGKSAQPIRRKSYPVRRRDLLLLLAGVAAPSRALSAQQKAIPVIGWLSPLSPSIQGGSGMPELGKYDAGSSLAAFHEGLKETGYVEGQNVVIEYHWAEGHFDRLSALAADLIAQKVDVIVTVAGTAPALAAKRATSTIPIVFTSAGNPVGSGLVASLARPGGNLTGFAFSPALLDPKRLELVSELVPQAGMIGVLLNPSEMQFVEGYTRVMQAAAHAKGVQLLVFEAGNENEIDAAFASLVRQHAGALVVAANAFFTEHGKQVLALAAQYAVPATYHLRGFAVAGGLISYGSRPQDLYRGAGTYVGRILAGAKPADLPVQQPTTFQLVINLSTAKALGLTIPPWILARADEVIE
jgi:putative tryptophan/tyrosine transport system substrate-binding protein